ncbi:hypothetical protein DLD77_09105 [Chitinophaga alhagiae]|uniref:Uncharacterized protein n=1 Tax=Chitinophaga alhagiae TaxID=2203219 RepID=A0ABM6WCV3_9BACT|nr:hypothetical protein [Chitinophaga alhagiae]AWO01843.1 hypothetical protein DLD77_09105 [Chitinophaga alhagiae]
MSFNFTEQYKHYTTAQLLQITLQPDAYQPQAVEAAVRLLEGRRVSDAEIDEASAYVEAERQKKQVRKEKAAAYKEKAKDLLEPMIQPGAAVRPDKWLYIFLFVLGLQYVWTLYYSLPAFGRFLQCGNCPGDVVTYVDYMFKFAYIPVLFYLLLKRNRWGWILVTAGCVAAVAFRLGLVTTFVRTDTLRFANLPALATSGLLNVAYVAYLLKKRTIAYFGVSAVVVKYTVWCVAITALLAGILL